MSVKRDDSPRDPWRRQLGGRLRQLRLARQLTQTEVSEQLGFMTAAWLSDIELGYNGCDAYDLARLVEFFAADGHYLLTGTRDRPLQSLLRAAADQLDSNLLEAEECPESVPNRV